MTDSGSRRVAGLPLPPFERHRIELRLAKAAALPFEHGGALRGLLSRALGAHELPNGLFPYACESGQVAYGAGDPYAFVVTLVGEDRAILPRLLDGLARVGGRVADGPAPLLGGNFVVERISALAEPDLEAEAAAIRGREAIEIHLRSILRLPRPKALRRRGAGHFDRTCFPADVFLDRIWRRLFLLAHGRYPEADERAARPLIGVDIAGDAHRLFDADLHVRGTTKKNRPYDLEGVRGHVVLRGIPESWLPILAAGMHLHLGQSIAFGLGRFTLAGTADRAEVHLAPATSLLARASEVEIVERALDHVLENLEAKDPGRAEQETLRADSLVLDLTRRLGRGAYRPGPLSGFVLGKDDGGVRPLAVPSLRDRVAQRAVVEVLAPALDTLLEDSSFAYRRGFSRQGAARAIERAYADGFRYVLDADIRAFFDQVDWSILFAKLEALFPGEPLLALLRTWIEAPVIFDGRRIRCDRGLPQGSPISPLLANLYLDTFDDALLGADFRLVRFADDFVVLTKDLERARAAKAAAERALADLRLPLNEDETAIRSFDDGFSYLGYLFVRSLVVEQRKAEADRAPAASRRLAEDAVPPGSWLAGVPLERIEALLAGKAEPSRRGSFERVPLATAAALDAGRWPLYVTSSDTKLFLRKGTVVIERSGEAVHEVPLDALSHVVFWGRVRATVPVLRGLARADVPSYFCRVDGSLESVFGPVNDHWPTWMAQAEAATNEGLRLRFAASVISARLRNLAVMAVRFGWGGGSPLAAALRQLARETENKTRIDSLLGLEGRGTALVFGGLEDALDPAWGFTGRARRPPPDPVNAMLSYGYSLLYNHAETALVIAGLNPRLGLMHESRGAHAALASDLMEELRHLVESVVWTLIRRRQIAPTDFRSSADGRYPALLGPEARRTFLDTFERRLLTELTPEGEEEPITYRGFLARQARQIRELVHGRAAGYEPLVLRG